MRPTPHTRFARRMASRKRSPGRVRGLSFAVPLIEFVPILPGVLNLIELFGNSAEKFR
jgi:hypothetical protein